MQEYAKGTAVTTADGSLTGALTGGNYACRLTCCRGLRLVVRWEDGRRSDPCTHGMDWDGQQWRIR